MRAAALGIFAGCTLFAVCLGGCAARPRMCSAQADCGAQASCLAGRCQPDARVAAIATTGVRRMIVAPVDAAFLRRGRGDAAGESCASCPVFALGRASDGGAMLLLRFALTLPPTSTILEAYLLLDRSEATDEDPTPIALHAVRIVEPWDGQSVTWARQPRVEEGRSPATSTAGARTVVRIDVRDLVRRWRQHSPSDQGIAVVADTTSTTGVPFVFAPPFADPAEAPDMPALGAPRAPPPAFFATAPGAGGLGANGDELPASSAVRNPPRLELYVK